MANFFDDEDQAEDAHALDAQSTLGNAHAGPSRRPLTDGNGNGNNHRTAGQASRTPSLLPPLADTTSTARDKGKARAFPPHDDYAPRKQHARASSTMSIDLDSSRAANTTVSGRGAYNNSNNQRTAANTTRGGGRSGPRTRDRGFLADEDRDEDDYDTTTGHATRRTPGEEDDEQADPLDGDGGGNESDIQQLIRLYMDERMSPELLKFPEELVTSLMQNLEAQTEAASVLLSSGLTSKAEEHERLLLVQMEIERVRWLLRSYLRTRTYKIEKQVQYLTSTPLAKNKMSEIEFGYAERYQSLIFRHFDNSVVGNIPERLGRLDEDEMIVRPELDQAVFARARRDCRPIVLPDQQILEMRKGEIHLVRYKSVRRLVRDGDVRDRKSVV